MSGRLVAQGQDRVTHGAPAPACGFWGPGLGLKATPARGGRGQLGEGMGLWRRASVDVSSSAALGTDCPTSVDTTGTKRMPPDPSGDTAPYWPASPREKGPWPLGEQGHGFKAVVLVRCSFLLPTTSLGSYIPAHFWSPRPGDTRAGPPVIWGGGSRAMAVPAEQPDGGHGSVGERGPTRARGDPERNTASLRAARPVCLQPTASAWPSPESWRRDRTVICQALLSVRQGARPFEHISIVYDTCLSGMCGRYPPALQTRR